MVKIDYSGVFYLLKNEFRHTTGAWICAAATDESNALPTSKEAGHGFQSSLRSGQHFPPVLSDFAAQLSPPSLSFSPPGAKVKNAKWTPLESGTVHECAG